LDGHLPDLCIGLVVSDKKIFKISANESTLWTLAAMLDFKSAPKTQIIKFKSFLAHLATGHVSFCHG
jgi:hypothetical protein